MLDLMFLGVVVIWSLGVGLRLLDLLHGRPDHPTDAAALAVPLGLGAMAMAVFGLGEIGLLTQGGIGVVFAVGFAVSAGLIRSSGRINLRATKPNDHSSSFVDVAFDLALAAVLAGSLLTALTPVTDGDALCYHLQVPKVFLAARSLVFEPDLHETVYPLVVELLYAVGLAWRGPTACRLIHWAMGLVFAANATALARPFLGARARWAGTIALLVPAVSNGMSAPLNDVALAAFATAALHAWVRWQDRPTPRGAALAGLLSGLALGVKYPALVWVGLLGLASAANDARRRLFSRDTSRNSLYDLALFATAAVIVGGPLYLRAYIYTENPVFPYFRHVFGGAGLDEVMATTGRPLGGGGWRLLTALGPMTLSPDRFDSFSHQFGPAFLLFLPGLALFRPPRRVLGLVVLGWAFLTICLTARQSMRFVLPMVGPMAVGAAHLAAVWSERRTAAGRALTASALLVLAFESAIALGHARNGITVVLGLESTDDYLARCEPTWVVGRWIDAHLPRDVRIVGQDHRGFYLPRPYTMELAHRRRTGLAARGEPADAIAESLQRVGFTHVLFCPPVPESAVEFDATLSRRLASWRAARKPLFDTELADGDGVLRRYSLYALNQPSVAVEGDARALQ